MRFILLISLLLHSLMANPIELEELLNNLKSTQLIEERIEQQALALQSQNLADSEESPLTYNQNLSKVNIRDYLDFEHEVSLSKVIKLGNVKELEQEQTQLNNEAFLLRQQKSLLSLNNRVKNLYHQHCMDAEYLNYSQNNYQQFLTLYEKKALAYRHDEISKVELLQLELEKKRLFNQLLILEKRQSSSRQLLNSLSSLESDRFFSCQDLYPLLLEVNIPTDDFSITQEAYQKQIASTQVGLERYSKKLESIEVSMGYTSELDRNLYTIGVSIPLTMSSRQSEYQRASLMHQSSALSLQNEQEINEKKYQVRRLKTKLSRLVSALQLKEENIEEQRTRLLPLIKKSYNYGESSVIEYLLTQQRLNQAKQSLLELKKEYYQTLFQLYTVSEIKEN